MAVSLTKSRISPSSNLISSESAPETTGGGEAASDMAFNSSFISSEPGLNGIWGAGNGGANGKRQPILSKKRGRPEFLQQ